MHGNEPKTAVGQVANSGREAARGSVIPVAGKRISSRSRLASAGAVFLALALTMGLGAPAGAASPQGGSGSPISAEASPQLFATLCALYASGLLPEASLSSDDPGFSEMRVQLLGLHGPAAEAMRKYYRDHILADRGATVSRYVTFGLLAGPPPKFSFPANREDLPPDVLALDGFSEVLANFYQEAGIEKLWRQFQPAYESDISDLLPPLGRVVQLETGYLREVLRQTGRTFTVYVEPLVGGGTNVRNIGDHYAIVASPSTDSLVQIRHAFLHYLLDPLPIRYAENIRLDAPLLKLAAQAPRLPREFGGDFQAFFAECLVRAVELRLRRLPIAQQLLEVDNAEGQGYVLVRPLLTALGSFENSEPSMTLYFPDLVRSINVAAELKRVQALTFLPAGPSAESGPSDENSTARTETKLNGDLEDALADGQRLIATQDGAGAAAAFQRVLDSVPGQPRALYGLAVASILRGDAPRAQELFEQVVAAAANAGNPAAKPDSNALAWSHVYLGRIHDLESERPQAIEDYRAVLTIGDAPELARAAAQRGIEQQYQPPAHDPSPK